MRLDLAKVAVWIARAIAFGWLATVVAGFAMPGGHPPAWYYFGGLVVLASFMFAPIGAGAAVVRLQRLRRDGVSTPRPVVVALWMNVIFLTVAIVLWCWFWWLATRR